MNSPPVIILGNPRSGTRMCANVLNLHPDICITNEFHNVRMLMRRADRQITSSMMKNVEPSTLPIRKELIVKSYWLIRSNLRQIEKSYTAKIIGNKTPTAESYFEIYENIFSINKPIYVYCARNAYDVLRSIKNLKNIRWNSLPFNDLFEKYKVSFRNFSKLKTRFPERVFIVNVDLYPKKPLFYFYKPIFDTLGIDCNEEFIGKINTMLPQNTMQNVKKRTKDLTPIIELTDEEEQIISSCEEYRKIQKTFFRL
ncbi:sulfotransferase [Microbulbifer sp. CnH-101-E]|uniref:sulfotransferase n=1 Tax=unclassified Microbulbifer TaxID=2619833 RepID=UPI004039F7BE